MTSENYKKYCKKIKKDFPELVKETKLKLKTSNSKRKDLSILKGFWKKLWNYANANWEMHDRDVLFFDTQSMYPMPQGVSKQLANMLFDIKNINLLFDLDIYEGL